MIVNYLKRSVPWLMGLLLAACSKLPVTKPLAPPPPVANMAEAKERLRNLRPLSAAPDSGYTVVSVQNYQAGERSISLVTYTDSEGLEQTVAYVTRPDGQGGFVTDTVTCESSSCNCAIEFFQTNDGTLDIRCSCTPCNMITH